MTKIALSICIGFFFLACHDLQSQDKFTEIRTGYQEVNTDEYELIRPKSEAEAVLILFGGYPERAVDIRREFKIADLAIDNKVAVVFMNYSRKLWLEIGEKEDVARGLQEMLVQHQLPMSNVYIGGFSSGGNVAFLVSSYLMEQKDYLLAVKGVFLVDSPIDLAALYYSAEKNVKRNFSAPSVDEGKWLIKELGKNFGEPENNLEKYASYSVYNHEIGNIKNLEALVKTQIRLYTEPDIDWWQKHRKAEYEQMNAYYIKSLSETLVNHGFKLVEYIATEDKGYRANGDRHPHSWSIVDRQELINWILGR
ncbi:MAG: hypothetical protein AAFN93_18900 [Bacteroidota bacterium]